MSNEPEWSAVSYRALYRVWRPQRFADVVGQEHVTRTLQNALRDGRIAHAYLFAGPRGTGKTSTAKILAKAVNCEQGPAPEPCNRCAACEGIAAGSVVDVVEIDAASNRGVDEIRDIREHVKFAPTQVRYKVYIIDEVHMLTTEAFNALLKTLEEPPAHVLFILATTEPHKLPATVVSRCQRFTFRRIGLVDLVKQLRTICAENGVEADERALVRLARAADGGMRDALSLLDQVFSFCSSRITVEDVMAVTGGVDEEAAVRLLSLLIRGDVAGVVEGLDDLIAQGKDPERVTKELLELCRELLLIRVAPDMPEVRERVQGDETLAALAKAVAVERLFAIIEELTRAQAEMRWIPHGRILLEMVLVKLARASGKPSPAVAPADGENAALIQRIAALEARLRQVEDELKRVRNERSGMGTAASLASEPSPVTASRRPHDEARVPWAQVEAVVRAATPDRLAEVVKLWPKVLAVVKARSLQVHALLVDGRPVAASADGVVVAFKNQFHRDATEKPPRKQLIEEALRDVLGRACRVVTLLEDQWVMHEASGGERQQGTTAEHSPGEDPIVEEARRLVGDDLVEIRE
ncbi:DNA polymerase III subunit gamma/tau [Calditerricola yamamurae]